MSEHVMKSVLISAIGILSSEYDRINFPRKVRDQIEQSKLLLEGAEPCNVSRIRSGVVLLQNAVNDISTNRIHSSLYFLGKQRIDNINRYNELCSLIVDFYQKLGDSDLCSYWERKKIEKTDYSDFNDMDPVDFARSIYYY